MRFTENESDNQKYTDEDYTITKVKRNPETDAEKEGTVIKEEGMPIRRDKDGKIILGQATPST